MKGWEIVYWGVPQRSYPIGIRNLYWSMTLPLAWHVQYRIGGAQQVDWYSRPEEVIEAACRLIDEGRDVSGIGADSPDDALERDQVARIYALWARPKRPFER